MIYRVQLTEKGKKEAIKLADQAKGGCVDPTPQPEHIEVAMQMADAIRQGRFLPDQENEMVFLIIETIKARRHNKAVEVKACVSFLDAKFKDLTTE